MEAYCPNSCNPSPSAIVCRRVDGKRARTYEFPNGQEGKLGICRLRVLGRSDARVVNPFGCSYRWRRSVVASMWQGGCQRLMKLSLDLRPEGRMQTRRGPCAERAVSHRHPFSSRPESRHTGPSPYRTYGKDNGVEHLQKELWPVLRWPALCGNSTLSTELQKIVNLLDPTRH